jgi:L-aminopeptidase/D-esterase-like protein
VTLAAAGYLGGVLRARPEGAQRVERPPAPAGSLTDVPGLRVGHWTDTRRPTGCTAILFDPEASVGVDYDGSAPGETGVVLLQPVSPVETVHGLFLTGGGMFGLAAHAGMIVSAGSEASSTGRPACASDRARRGDRRSGARRSSIRPVRNPLTRPGRRRRRSPSRRAGAGAGATVGRMLRRDTAGGMKGGLGTASLRAGDLVIGALAVVNAAGDVLDWRTGTIVAGARRPDGKGLADIVEVMRRTVGRAAGGAGLIDDPFLRTTLVVVATNLALNKTQMTKVAMMANCGAARAIRPYHTTGDGDQLFAASTRQLKRTDLNITTVGTLAAEVVAEAVLRGVLTAVRRGWPAARDMSKESPGERGRRGRPTGYLPR